MINFIEKCLLPSIIGLILGIFMFSDVFNIHNNFICLIGFILFVISLTFLISVSFYMKIGIFGFCSGILFSTSVSCLMAAFIMGSVSWMPENNIVHTILWIVGLPLLILGGIPSTTYIIIIRKRH